MNYYNFLISTENNILKVVKLRSEDGSAEGTGLIDQNGESIHPSINNFISQQGILIDPETNKVSFSYLNNFISTPGCSLIQETFVASEHDLSFLPDAIKSLYEPQVISDKIQFITTNNKRITLEDRPGRIIDYQLPDQGSSGEDDQYDYVSEILEKIPVVDCNYDVIFNIDSNNCWPIFSLDISKTVKTYCYNTAQYLESTPCESKESLGATENGTNSSGEKKYKIFWQLTQSSQTVEEKTSNCKNSEVTANVNISFKDSRTGADRIGGLQLKTSFGGDGKILDPNKVISEPGLGLKIIEAGVSIANTIANPIGAAAGGVQVVADGVAAATSLSNETSGISKVASTLANPVGAGITYAFDMIEKSLTQKLGDITFNIRIELQKIYEKCKNPRIPLCEGCIDTTVSDAMKNKSSQLRRLVDKLVKNSGIDPCCK